MTFQEMYRCYDYKKPKNEKILKGYFLNIYERQLMFVYLIF